MNSKVLKPVLSCSSINWVSFKVNNIDLDWLADTGASISAVKLEILSRINYVNLIKNKITIDGIGGSLESEGYVFLKLEYKGNVFEHKFHVFRELSCKASGILGQDFIKKHYGVIDFERDTLSITTFASKQQRRVTLPLQFYTYSLHIGARCEIIKYVPININYDCIVIPKEIQDGVFIASTVASPKNGRIPIRILNTTRESVELKLSNIKVDKLSEYYCGNFEKTNCNADRVKLLFQMLNLSSYLKGEEQATIEKVCAKFPDIFHLPGDRLSVTNVFDQSIRLKDGASPVYRKQYRIPNAQREELNRQIGEMLNDNIIEESCSEWSSPLLLVPKKPTSDGKRKWRVVIDYRQLNENIQDDKFPLPNITEILESLSGAFYFSHCDLSQSYYQCQLNKNSRKYTSFTTDTGQYQMTRLPMGLKISPSAFSRLMTVAMSGLNYEKCLVYLDDLIIFGRNLEEHNINLMSVFTRLRKVNLKLNPQKCEFLKRQILYLGHIISAEGILPDPDKISSIENYPTPTTTDDVKRFVAMANYYRKFINNFAAIASPLNKLGRKGVKFEWTKECQSAFVILKKALSEPPILDYPDFRESNRFILTTDSSGFAIGGVLCNSNGRPVAYASRKLEKGELNYQTIEKELVAIVWSIKYFRPYLFGKKFTIRTDHRPLVYLFGMKDPSSRLTKFRLKLEEYDFDVEYVRGCENVVADALSRIIISSDELKSMSKNVVNVMTRAQARRMKANDNDCENDYDIDKNKTDYDDLTINPTFNRSDQPVVVDVLKKLDDDVELSILSDCDLRKLIIEKREFIELSKNRNIIYIEPNRTLLIGRSSLSAKARDDLLRDLSDFSKKLNIKEVIMIKNDSIKEFCEWLARYVRKCKDWEGPRFCLIKDVKRIYSKDDKLVIMNDFHLLPSSGHVGMRRMLNKIKRYYYWPSMQKDVVAYVDKCEQCQKQKYTSMTKEPLTVTTTATTAFEKVYLDVVGPIDRDDDGNCYILTLQCELTKYVEAYPLKSKSTVEVARAFVENFILRYGIPKEIATDRGTEFISSTMDEICKILKISQIMSTAYHHQSIGSLENSHKQLGAYLRIQTENHPSNWSSWVQYWCFSHNTAVHTSTKYTPFELVFGQLCRLPNSLCNNVEPLYNNDSFPLEFKYRLQRAQTDARNNLLKSKIVRKIKYDKSINPVVYKPGDSLLLKNETGTKLDQLYLGPYEVVKDNAPNVVIKIKDKIVTVHKDRTKLFKS